MIYTPNFLIGILYHFGLHSEYDNNKHCFSQMYNCGDIMLNLAKAKSAVESNKNENGQITDINYVFIIPYTGTIPNEVLKNMKDISLFSSKYSFGSINGCYLVATIESFIIFLNFLKNSNNLSIADIEDIIKKCEKRYVRNECLYGEEINLNYLSEKSFDFYAENSENGVDNIDFDLFLLLQKIDDLNFAELANSGNSFFQNGIYSLTANDNAGTVFETFRAMQEVNYSIMHRCRFTSLNDNNNYELVRRFMRYFFAESMEEYEVLLEHQSVSEFADSYSIEQFANYHMNSITIMFTDENKNKLFMVYSICTGDLMLFSSGEDSGVKMLNHKEANAKDKIYINSILTMMNGIINKDIKHPQRLTK